MKDAADRKTAELPGLGQGHRAGKPGKTPSTEGRERQRGRPPKPDANTPAERMREYRARKRAEREARRDTSKPPTSKILDLSGDVGAALADRDEKD